MWLELCVIGTAVVTTALNRLVEAAAEKTRAAHEGPRVTKADGDEVEKRIE